MENQDENERQYLNSMRPKPIWEGAIGVTFDVFQNSNTDEYFFAFELVRCYRDGDYEKMQYSHSFTEKNVNALAKVLSRAMQFIAETDANQWVEAYNKRKMAA